MVEGRLDSCTFFESVKTTADGALLVVLLGAGDVAEVGVLVCDERGFEVGLLLVEIVHCYGAGGTHFVWFVVGEEEGEDESEEGGY